MATIILAAKHGRSCATDQPQVPQFVIVWGGDVRGWQRAFCLPAAHASQTRWLCGEFEARPEWWIDVQVETGGHRA